MYSWSQESPPKPRVKREDKFEAKDDLAVSAAKRDIIKSLMMTSLVLSLIVVIYLLKPNLMGMP